MAHITSAQQDFLSKLKGTGSLTEELETKLKSIVESFMESFDPAQD